MSRSSCASTLREFAADVLRPAAREADESSQLPEGLLDQAWELGLTDTQLPGAVGGGDEPRSPITNALVLEELGCGDAALGLAVAQPSLFAFAVADLGTPEQKKRWLPLFTRLALPRGLAWRGSSPRRCSTRSRSRPRPSRSTAASCSRGEKRCVRDRRPRRALPRDREERAERETGFGALDAFVVPRDAKGVTRHRDREEPRPQGRADGAAWCSTASRSRRPTGSAARPASTRSACSRCRAPAAPRCCSASAAR